MRKVVGISQVMRPSANELITAVVCGDGTVFRQWGSGGDWKKLPPIPLEDDVLERDVLKCCGSCNEWRLNAKVHGDWMCHSDGIDGELYTDPAQFCKKWKARMK